MTTNININCIYQILDLPGQTTQISVEYLFMAYVIICAKHTASFYLGKFTQTLIDADSSKSLD